MPLLVGEKEMFLNTWGDEDGYGVGNGDGFGCPLEVGYIDWYGVGDGYGQGIKSSDNASELM